MIYFFTFTVEPVNVERKKEVNDMWSALEDLLRETTKKRKEYPPLITDAVRNVLQYKVQIVVGDCNRLSNYLCLHLCSILGNV